MMLRHNIAVILALSAACGDNEGSSTASSNTTPTTAQMTDGPATLATSDSENTGTNTNTTSDPTGETTTVSTASTTSTGENAPVFISLSTNVNAITEGESVIFTAILTDPDGVQDIIGGSLLKADGSADFGPFVAAGQEGTYSITLSWAQIHQAVPIHFEDMAESRTFNAQFFDQAANSTTKTISVNLQCAGGSACDGTCTDLASDGANCGSCGHSCTSMDCEGGGCSPTWSECFVAADGFDTCSQICQSIGETCAEAQCEGSTTHYFGGLPMCLEDAGGIAGGESCEKVQAWANPAIKCCCTDSN